MIITHAPVRLAVATGVAVLAVGLTGCTAEDEPAPGASETPETTESTDTPEDTDEASPTPAADPLETLAGTWESVPEGADMATLTLVIGTDGSVEYTGPASLEGTLVPGSDDTHLIETTDYLGEEPDTWEVFYDSETDTLDIDMTYVVEPANFVFTRIQ